MSEISKETSAAAFPWIRSYPTNIDWHAEIHTGPVYQLLDDATANWPERPALDFNEKSISYRELGELVSRAAKGLQTLGVAPGTHVGLYLPNTPHYVIAFFAILKIGGVVVNYSPLDAEKVIEHKVKDSNTQFLITLDLKTLYPKMARLLGKTPLMQLVIGHVGEMTHTPEAIQSELKKGDQLSDIPDDGQHTLFHQLLNNDGKYQRHAVVDPTTTLAVLQYTGGTTGLPKGAMLTHANLTAACGQVALANAINAQGSGDKSLEHGQERVLVVLPLFHIYAITINMLFGIHMAAELILHPRFELEAVVKDLANRKVTIFAGVPTMYTALAAYPGIAELDLSSLKWCSSGGAPMPVEVLHRFEQVAQSPLCEGWGMTETSSPGTFTPHFKRKPGSCGIPCPGVTIKFASVENPSRFVSFGERGEICVRGPNVMSGYWQQPEATADAMTSDGFFRTGDVGYMDEDGFVYIVDRTKDMILCGGYNVYPRNIEEAIYQHPSVAEVTVIGTHDAYRGQSPKAFIKLKQNTQPFSLEELKAFLQDRLGKHEMVQAIEFRSELPKTPVGKLSKKELYEEEKARGLAQTAIVKHPSNT